MSVPELAMWSYRVEFEDPGDIGGYAVNAVDGHIGKVDKHSIEAGRCCIVVDIGRWLFGKKVLLPAGVIERIDNEHEVVYVDRTKQQIQDAPEYSEGSHEDEDYRNRLSGYYGSMAS